MKQTPVQTLILLSLLVAWVSCQRVSPDIVQPQPTPVPPAPTIDLLKQDPALLIEGVYTGDIYTRTITRIGLLGLGTNLLIKRLGTHRIEIQSIYGQMNTYQVDLTVNKDTIMDVPGQTIDLTAIIRDNKPIELHAGGTSKILLSEERPDLANYDWLNTEFRPLSAYRSTTGLQPSLGFLTGVYTAQLPYRVSGSSGFTFIHRPVVVRQISSNEVELSDINRWETPQRFTLQKSTGDSTWTGENNTLKMAITVVSGQPQRFAVQPKVADTLYIEQWPPLNFEYNVQKPSEYSTYIRL